MEDLIDLNDQESIPDVNELKVENYQMNNGDLIELSSDEENVGDLIQIGNTFRFSDFTVNIPVTGFGPIDPGMKRIIVSYNDLEFPINWFED